MTDEHRVAADDWERLAALWEAAAELPTNQRDEMLRSNAVDGALRAEFESLLAHASAAEAFFDRLRARVADTAHTVEEMGQRAADAPDDATPRRGVDPMLDTTVGHYHIDALLGQGGMGVVYRATDLRLRRTVALKLLRAQTPDDSRAKERLLAEARAAGALDNANICTIYEVGETDEQVSFIAMAYYPGETLEQVLRRGSLPLSVAIDYATQIARGLAAAHQRGIIHRDIKPANIAVTADGVVKLLDFGIARTMDVGVSHDGVTPGTIAYMSPEQVTSGSVGPRSDLWSLGIVLYEMCAGVRPFGGEHVGAILYAIVHEPPRSAAALRPDLPAHLGSIIDRLLVKDPAERYGDAETLMSDLTSTPGATPIQKLETRRSRTRLSRRAVRYGVAALVLGVLAVFWPRTRGSAPSERRIAAQDLYAQGHRDVLFRTESGRREALGFFRQAIAVDSTYATAHAGLAHLLVLISDNSGGSRRSQLREAEAAARTAIRLDSLLAEAHAALGHVLLFDYQFAEAESEFKRAVALDPTTPYVREFLVWLYVFMNRPRDALKEAERGTAENPNSPTAIAEAARALLVNGRCNDALPLLKRLAYLQPPPARVGAIAAQCYAQQKMWQNAIDAVRPVAEQSPLQGYPWLGFMLARGGETDRGREIRDTLLEQWRRGNGGAYGVALTYAGLRDYSQAFVWLDKSIEDRSLRYNIMEPAFEDLRRDPRFDRVWQKLGIAR
jgi:serine/threonine protein kinase/Flp pilus assembly protein TadD